MTEHLNNKLKEIATKFNVQTETVSSLLQALIRGNGTMAQFNIAELGGHGQWMRGGMTMVGDLFNNSLKNTVDLLCYDLSELYLSGQISADEKSEFASKEGRRDAGPSMAGQWPEEFGPVTTGGSQNEMRYAYFAASDRLIVENHGKRTIYDTKGISISGVSQQQANSFGTLVFTGPGGNVRLEDLKPVPEPGSDTAGVPAEQNKSTEVSEPAPSRTGMESVPNEDVFLTIERLYDLSKKGIITADEFETKRKELLKRL